MFKNRKGFTIVELVIVIAIIAILAAVLIPTFSNVISKANEAACVQEANNKFKELYVLDYADGLVDGKIGDDSFVSDSGFAVTRAGYTDCTYETANGAVKLFTFKATKNKKKATLTVYNGVSNEWSFEDVTS